MKRVISFLFCVLIFTSLVSAKITIHDENKTIEEVESAKDTIKGRVNITITDEPYDLYITSNDDDSILIKDFFDKSNIDPICSTPDCEPGYSKSIESGRIIISPSARKVVGFYFQGKDVRIGSMTFKVQSDFRETVSPPLSIDFFGAGDSWVYEKFSDTYGSKDWGCYDDSIHIGENTLGPPIGSTPYCELIKLPKTNKVRLSAIVSDREDLTSEYWQGEHSNLTMHLISEDGTVNEECEYDITQFGNDYCEKEAGEGYTFSGNYHVCVSSETLAYRIHIDNRTSRTHCGFSQGSSVQTSTRDYAISAQSVKHADYTNVQEDFEENVDMDNLLDLANTYLEEIYGKECSSGCILPLEFFGVDQSAMITDVYIEYFHDEENDDTRKLYEVETTNPIFNYSGFIDFKFLDFHVSKSGKYILEIGNEEGDETIFEKTFDIESIPKILSISPMNPAAGIPVTFTANVDYNGSATLSYLWSFGDGINQTNYDPYITHTYEKLGEYDLSIKVIATEDLYDEYGITIEAITPEAAITSGLALRKESVASIETAINKVPSWYRSELLKMANIEEFSDQLKSIEENKELVTKPEEYIKLAVELFEMNVPVKININNFDKPFLTNKLEDVEIKPVLGITNDLSEGTNDDYSSPILNWQNTNIQASLVMNIYEIFMFDKSSAGKLSAYTFNIESLSSENGYFVINTPLSSLYFGTDVGAKESEGATVIPVAANKKGYVQFYYKSDAPLSYFISPKLTSLVVESDIDETCNYNSICEEENGEDPDTCRSDCKPVKKAVYYGVLIFMGMLIFYSILQIWYNKRYEKYLFKDERELYNLLMFMANAKTRGMSDSKIAGNLRAQGWSNERVAFVIKRANGKRTGLFEIIPISKISALIRNAKARREQKAQAQEYGDQKNMDGQMSPSGIPPPLTGNSGYPPYR